MKFIRVRPVGGERRALVAEDGRAYDLRSLTPANDGAFFADDGIERLVIAGEVAAAIAYLASPVTGTALAVDGGIPEVRVRPAS